MRNKLLIIGLLVLGNWFSSEVVIAQDNVIDEVIWIVGEEAILRSEVEEERLRAQYEGQPIAGDPYCVIPEQLAIQKLFLHQAELDSIEANESSPAGYDKTFAELPAEVKNSIRHRGRALAALAQQI